MKLFRQHGGLILVLLLSWWAVKALVAPGFFPTHDDTQVVRVQQMAQALADGHFPVRWVKDLGYGYGYPLFNFYAPLPYYVGGLVTVTGIDALTSTKIMMLLGVLSSGIFMFLLGKAFWGELGGVVSALFYMYAPYHAVDIYVRGAVGEFWAMAFLPLLFFGVGKVYRDPKWKWMIIGSLGFAGIVLSHNLTAMMVAPFILIAALLHSYIVYRGKKLFTIYYLLFTIILGLGLSAFYWIPAIWQMRYTNILSQIGGGADFRDHFVCLAQLWESSWGFGGSIAGCVDGLSFRLGKLHITLAVVSMIILATMLLRKKRPLLPLFSLFVLLSSLFLMTEQSKFIWESVGLMAFLQYPWRFLLLATFCASLLAGFVIWFLKRQDNTLLISSMLVLVLLASNGKLFQPQTQFLRSEKDYVNEYNIKWITSKVSDEYMPGSFQKPTSATDIVRKRIARGEVLRDKTQALSFLIDQGEKAAVLVRIAPFPAWKASIDGRKVESKAEKTGIALTIPKGKHRVDLSFVNTPVFIVSNLISMVSLLVLVGGILWRKRVVKTRFAV